MNLKPKVIVALGVFLSIILANAVILLFPSPGLIRNLSGLLFLFLPGSCLISALLNRKIKLIEFCVFSILMSLCLLVISGLLMNQLLLYFHITQTFSLINVLFLANILTLLPLFGLIVLKKNPFSIEPQNIGSHWFINALAFITPLLSVAGALSLNNGHSSTLTAVMLIYLSILTFLTILFKNLFGKSYSFIIFTSALSLVLMYCLRSNYLIGWDIQSEYKVFIGTLNNLSWSPTAFSHAYNTTLGVTILPTLISQLTGISALFVFKYIYPVIFSFSAVIILVLLEEFVPSEWAFLTSFFFIAQFQFFEQMPAIARQEISMIFFLAGIFILFTKKFNYWQKMALFLLFNVAMILCHYSTAYVALGAYCLTYGSALFVRIVNKFKKFVDVPKMVLTLPVIILLGALTLYWYGIFAGDSSYVKGVAQQILGNLTRITSQEGKSQQAQEAIVGSSSIYTQSDLEKYEIDVTNQYKLQHPWVMPYSQDILNKYPIYPRYPVDIPTRNASISSIVHNFIELDQKLIKLALVLSLLFVSVLILLKKFKKIPIYFVLFGWSFLFLVLVAIFVPYISVVYNIERIYQQSLIFLGLFAVVGILSPFLLLKINPKIGYFLITFLFVSYLFSYAGMLSLFIGGAASLNLDNFGDEYQRFYIKDTEYSAATWLGDHAGSDPSIFADNYGALRLYSGTQYEEGILTDLYPGIIDQNGYVFVSSSNLIDNNVRVTFNSKFIIYNFPKKFFDDNKNLVYSNSETDIYK